MMSKLPFWGKLQKIRDLTDSPAGIPNLGVMDVVGNLKYFATDVDFRCTGSTVTESDSIL